MTIADHLVRAPIADRLAWAPISWGVWRASVSVWTPGTCSSAARTRWRWRPSIRDESGIRTSRMWMRPGPDGCGLVR